MSSDLERHCHGLCRAQNGVKLQVNKGLFATLVNAHATVMSQYNLAACLPRNRLRLRNTSSLIPPNPSSSPGPCHRVSDQYCNATKMLCVN
ncbi:hypothetical protein TRIATDRAFT_254536 [Trichoderma atroviride IMI 206040]|uniref:Uncharacterized protein n=1 Tax=Hypocrea atroviridis (strain ATCC 20476 / IMI 206040) TaxID=452589 RepID=G9NGN8_HYPAI|nr:uncharacterized protein TRIATDRAFT_254536 [Trichoderma atroviride IMI 206040]EHK50449.1 hypothetical protein TRIATDRAFT_254536 [Trichoderma atroviride IMI 206040]